MSDGYAVPHSGEQPYVRIGSRTMTCAQHSQWLESLSDDDKTIVHAPAGWRYSLVVASLTKRTLETVPMTGADQLKVVQGLAKISGGGVSAEAIAHVKPACATAAAMAKEGRHNLDVYAQFDVFREFVRLNPSLLEALRLCGSFHPSNNRDDLRPNSI